MTDVMTLKEAHDLTRRAGLLVVWVGDKMHIGEDNTRSVTFKGNAISRDEVMRAIDDLAPGHVATPLFHEQQEIAMQTFGPPIRTITRFDELVASAIALLAVAGFIGLVLGAAAGLLFLVRWALG